MIDTAATHTVFFGTVIGVRTRPDLKDRPLDYADRGFYTMAGERLEHRA